MHLKLPKTSSLPCMFHIDFGKFSVCARLSIVLLPKLLSLLRKILVNRPAFVPTYIYVGTTSRKNASIIARALHSGIFQCEHPLEIARPCAIHSEWMCRNSWVSWAYVQHRNTIFSTTLPFSSAIDCTETIVKQIKACKNAAMTDR